MKDKLVDQMHKELKAAGQERIQFAPAIVKCAFCGHEGIYGKEIVDTDYHDYNIRDGHDTIVMGCKDTHACAARGGGTRAIYY